MYAGAVICFGGLIFAGIRMISGRFQDAIPGLFGALFGAGVLGWGAGWIGSLTGQTDVRDHANDQARGAVTDQSGAEQIREPSSGWNSRHGWRLCSSTVTVFLVGFRFWRSSAFP